jgi:sugar phosphate isomerase/epimerase
VILACQENLLPGDDLAAKWTFAAEAGFDGIELQGQRGFGARLDELVAAGQLGAVFPSVCVNGGPFIGDFEAEGRSRAVTQMKQLLSTIAAVGGRGAITPAAFGQFSSNLPPFTPPRTAEGDREVLLAALRELAAHAEEVGAQVFLEPLNRYEDHMLNRVEQALELCELAGSSALRVMADTYHMNIEETVPADVVRHAGPRLAHLHLSDSNRGEPGAGHIDFRATLAAARAGGFDGILAYECRLSGRPEDVLPPSVRAIRAAWEGRS